MKEELNLYRTYCNHAEGLLKDTEEKVPYDAVAVRRGLPILGRKLKRIIEEIQEKAEIACRDEKGKPAECAACAVNDFAKNLDIRSPKYLMKQIESLVFCLSHMFLN